jgi:hypothetical protein
MNDDEIRTAVAKYLHVPPEQLQVFAIERQADGSIRLLEAPGESVQGNRGG